MSEIYEYRTAGRQPLVIGCYAIVLLVVLFSARHGAGPWLWSLWALATVALCHQLLGYPLAGSRIDNARWVTFIDRRRRIIALKAIRMATLTDCRGAHCACILQMQDRSTLKLPAICLPPAATLARALRKRGIKVVIDRPRDTASQTIRTPPDRSSCPCPDQAVALRK